MVTRRFVLTLLAGNIQKSWITGGYKYIRTLPIEEAFLGAVLVVE